MQTGRVAPDTKRTEGSTSESRYMALLLVYLEPLWYDWLVYVVRQLIIYTLNFIHSSTVKNNRFCVSIIKINWFRETWDCVSNKAKTIINSTIGLWNISQRGNSINQSLDASFFCERKWNTLLQASVFLSEVIDLHTPTLKSFLYSTPRIPFAITEHIEGHHLSFVFAS